MKHPLTKKGATKHDVFSLGKNLGLSISLHAQKSAVLVQYVETAAFHKMCIYVQKLHLLFLEKAIFLIIYFVLELFQWIK